MARLARKCSPTSVLDVATGTCDLAIAVARKACPKSICGVDLSEEMLNVGRAKVKKANLSEIITLQKGDAENLPFADDTFDAITVAFGVRNFENLEKGLKEMHRVLKPGGSCIILEFTMPRRFPVKQLYNFYFRRILPLVGRVVSSNKVAYTYLPESVKAFPQYADFVDIMKRCGYSSAQYRVLSMGIAAIYIGIK